ncbi:MAG: ribosome-associated translation inhibitor RaiA [Actinomycetia bacterium]|nr:ribosome-associated translation inhibitor RaiA [Actinomycetes bacterium]
MRLQVKGKNLSVNPDIQEYAEQKLHKIGRHLHDEATQVELELSVEKNPSIAERQVAEATIWTKGPVLRARESSRDMHAAIDLLIDKLERQAKRYREKRQRKHLARQHVRGQPPAHTDGHEELASEPMIVKTKQFAVKPMSAEEAALQLELIGHDFFVFRNDDSEEVNVLYRRRDGNYGLIEPIA